MEQNSFKSKHPLARKLLFAAGLATAIAVGTLAVPRLADKLSDRMIKNSASAVIPDEGPAIVRNQNADEQ